MLFRSAPPASGVVEDPRAIIAREPMGNAQLIAIAICIALTALDGFDVLSISFASRPPYSFGHEIAAQPPWLTLRCQSRRYSKYGPFSSSALLPDQGDGAFA